MALSLSCMRSAQKLLAFNDKHTYFLAADSPKSVGITLAQGSTPAEELCSACPLTCGSHAINKFQRKSVRQLSDVE